MEVLVAVGTLADRWGVRVGVAKGAEMAEVARVVATVEVVRAAVVRAARWATRN